MSSLLALLLLFPQDLIERDRSLRRRLPPSVDRSATKPQRASLEIETKPNFGCGGFDLSVSTKAIFQKNVKEELLGAAFAELQAELAGSALVLACYASPTVCDALKHYRISTQGMLGMELDACRSLEQAVDDAPRRAQARAIKECLDEKARQGRALDEAQRECRKSAQMRGTDGKPVRQLDLLKDLGIPESLVQPITLSAGGLRAESRSTAVIEAYEARRREHLEAWRAAFRDPSGAALEKLEPLGRAEVERVALMEPARREAAARSMAAASALAQLTREAHEAERALEGRELLAAPEVRIELERRRAQLRNEITRLAEEFEMERRVNATASEALAAAEAEVAQKAHERLASRRAGEASRAAVERFKPWGCDVKDSKDRRKDENPR